MSAIKKAIKSGVLLTTLGRRAFYLRNQYNWKISHGDRLESKWKFILNNLNHVKVFSGKDSSFAISSLIDHLPIEISEDNEFYYDLEPSMSWCHPWGLIGNTTVDMNLLVSGSLESLKLNDNSSYGQRQNRFVDSLIRYAKRISKAYKKLGNQFMSDCWSNMVDSPSRSFHDAVQRVLFVNQLLWQTDRKLNGLGNLDKILYPYYQRDLDKNVISKDSAHKLLINFCQTLHRYYDYKSAVLLGDIGQIILLGGSDSEGNYICNELTYEFISIMKELQQPDPKVFLKVNKNTPKDLLSLAAECIATGIGCPILANDDEIVPDLIEYGYDPEDALNYGVAACWEPLIPGKSFDQNNLTCINLVLPLCKLFSKSGTLAYDSYDSFIKAYLRELKFHVTEKIQEADDVRFNEDICFSTFIPSCREKHRDITEGGAKYNNKGLLSVGMGNVVNSLLNIKKYVYDSSQYTLQELSHILQMNYAGFDDVRQKFQFNSQKFGHQDDEVINLTKLISSTINQCLEGKTNRLGGKFRFGLSSPSYIIDGSQTPASLDGRFVNQAFSTHISSDDGVPYTELVNFASQLDYDGYRINGNVIDFIVAPELIKRNLDKFVIFLKQSIKLGFFEMQMNVVSSKTLIEAKAHPEKFPNLIVRVWGFSAYFKDLPEEYKNVLIERAQKAERYA